MADNRKLKDYFVTGLSWIAKGMGLALLLMIVVIFIGEGPPNPLKLTPRELFLFASLLITLAGIVIAFWKQLVGGIAILVGMIPFLGESLQWVLYAFLLTGALNIVCWWLKKRV
jgi:hypothetical protein